MRTEYSDITSVRILVALLKAHGVRQAVLAPGGSDIPIVHSLETDPYFSCHSVVDERSLVYFAMGIAQQTGEPVACVCTSGTAVSNFLPGMTEAFYQDVPLVAITADKDPRRTNQLELQKTEQAEILMHVTRKDVDLPLVTSKEDAKYCARLINEALAELRHHGGGPVQINIPIIGDTATYTSDLLPKVRPLTIHEVEDSNSWLPLIETLRRAQKILVVAGQQSFCDQKTIDAIDSFTAKYNCCVSVEIISNLTCKRSVKTYPVTEMLSSALPTSLIPDVIISFGNNLSSYKLKPFIRGTADSVVHWQIDPAGRSRDMFDCLTDVFECSPRYFFEYFAVHAEEGIVNDGSYLAAWAGELAKLKIGKFEFSNFYVAQELAKQIPAHSILHCAILNSTRVMQFFNLDSSIRIYSNIGALGIDGCLSTFMGQATMAKGLAFLLIGDLSFFYDMNAAGLRDVGNNVRIVLLNNGGGSEFHFFMGKKNIPTIDQYICAEHSKIAKGWLVSLGYEYYAAKSKDDLADVLPKFVSADGGPKVLEVFTGMEHDADLANGFYSSAVPKNVKTELKKAAKNVLSPKQRAAIKRVLGR